MATTMTLIAKQTIGSAGVTSITFSNIPQTYTDLKIVSSARGSTSNVLQSVNLTFNSSRTTNMTRLYVYGSTIASDTSVGNGQGEAGFIPGATATASIFSNNEIYIPNYRSTASKSYSDDSVVENNSSSDFLIFMTSGLNTSVTTAITSITLDSNAGDFVEFSTIYLYGISSSSTQNTSVPYAYGGDIIKTDGTYWYHTFLYSGTFTPLKALTCDYLVVAGGGGGGVYYSGGGGGGGLLYATNSNLTSNTNYTVTIGAGGAAAGVSGTGSSGSNSVFGSSTALGGGFGGMWKTSNPQIAAGSGGSGGGGAGYDNNLSAPYYKPGGAATQGNSGGATGYGNAGGQGYYPSGFNPAAGGGGGAGAAGSDGTNSTAGNGGIGRQYNISGTNTYYAGGGGGSGENRTRGTGGLGGGGNGAEYTVAFSSAGSVNTGGGGGGGVTTASDYVGSAGGSGIVVVRYAV